MGYILRAVLPFGGSKNSICHEIEFIFSDIDIIEAYRKTDTGIEFHDRITESVRAFIGEQAENTEGYDFAVQVFVTMTRDRGAVIDTVREGGIVVIIRNMSRHIGNDTGGDDDIQSDLHEGIADFVRF